VHIPDAPVEILVRHKPPALSPTLAKTPVGCKPLALPPISTKIPERYKPLALPPILHDFPANYRKNCPGLMERMPISLLKKTSRGLKISLTFMRLKMTMSISGCFPCLCKAKLKIGLKTLPAASINNFHQFMQVFLDRWVIMRNVFLILEEYDHLKRQPGETVQQFSARFNKVYHAMPADIRPPPGSAHLHYPDAFDPEMTFQLREQEHCNT
jgi:hypothetical protein